MMKTGQVARIVQTKGFGFISTGTQDFFFHRDDCSRELWNVIVDKVNAGEDVHVTFEPWDAPKGKRAANIKVIN